MQKQLDLFQKIEVVKSNKQTKPGSVGYIISIKDSGLWNTLDLKAMFTRFGRSGRSRFSVCSVAIPFIDIDSLPISGSLKEKLKLLTNKYLTSKFRNKVDSIIKVVPEKSKDLIELDVWSFVAYISAISIFLSNHNITPPINVNANINNLDEATVNGIGYLIYRTYMTRNPKLQGYVEYFNDDQNRRKWLDKLRREVSIYKEIIKRHLRAVSNAYKSNYLYLKDMATENGLMSEELNELFNIY